MLRRSVLAQKHLTYDENLICAQDFDLWTRLLQHTRGANLGTPLVCWRNHANNVTSLRREQQARIARAVVQRQLTSLLGRPLDPALGQELGEWYFTIPSCETGRRWHTALLAVEILEALSSCPDLDQDELAAIHGDWLLRLSTAMPLVRWPAWARAALLQQQALPHLRPIARQTARQLWHRVRARTKRP